MTEYESSSLDLKTANEQLSTMYNCSENHHARQMSRLKVT